MPASKSQMVFKRFKSSIPIAVAAALVAGLAWTWPAFSQASAAESQKALFAQADAILEQMSRLTGLKILAPVKKEIVDRAQVRQYLIQNFHHDFTPRELQDQEDELQAFGLISQDFHLESFLIKFYTEQAAGFYDPRSKTMFIANWVGPDIQKMVLAHELTHALQDQHFDLEKYLHAVRDNDDAMAARDAVVEGEATATMVQQDLGPVDLASLPSLVPLMEPLLKQQVGQFPVFSSSPYFFRFEAMFPYIQGLGFIQANLAGGGWPHLNALFTNPPAETREIFDPEVYLKARPLPNVSLPRPRALKHARGLRWIVSGTLGELGYDAMVGQLLSPAKAKTIAPAWRADRYLLYQNTRTRNFTLIGRTLWASPESALAFFRDYHAILAHKYPALAPSPRSATDLFIGSAPNGRIVLLRAGSECRWAEGVPAGKMKKMIKWLRSLGGETSAGVASQASSAGSRAARGH